METFHFPLQYQGKKHSVQVLKSDQRRLIWINNISPEILVRYPRRISFDLLALAIDKNSDWDQLTFGLINGLRHRMDELGLPFV